MSILVIRHALSEANNRENRGTPAFGDPNAALMEEGKEQARKRGKVLRERYGLNLKLTSVAVSNLRRTRETAELMGFDSDNIHPYDELNEVGQGTKKESLEAMIEGVRRGELPEMVLAAARAIRDARLEEKVWVTHGLVIAGLCRIANIHHRFDRVIPRFCEVRELPTRW